MGGWSLYPNPKSATASLYTTSAGQGRREGRWLSLGSSLSQQELGINILKYVLTLIGYNRTDEKKNEAASLGVGGQLHWYAEYLFLFLTMYPDFNGNLSLYKNFF